LCSGKKRHTEERKATKLAAKASRSPADIEAETQAKHEKKRPYQREYQRECQRRKKTGNRNNAKRGGMATIGFFSGSISIDEAPIRI